MSEVNKIKINNTTYDIRDITKILGKLNNLDYVNFGYDSNSDSVFIHFILGTTIWGISFYPNNKIEMDLSLDSGKTWSMLWSK